MEEEEARDGETDFVREVELIDWRDWRRSERDEEVGASSACDVEGDGIDVEVALTFKVVRDTELAANSTVVLGALGARCEVGWC